MNKVLFIKANNRPADQSVSVQMYNAFKHAYQETNPNDQITELDLFAADLPYYDVTMMTGLYKLANGYDPSAEEQAVADIANRYLDQFLSHDKIVFAFPLWNFTIPAQLLTYLFYLNQVGKTFKYTPQGAVGLAGDKKVALLNARGGVYSEGPRTAIEMSVSYVRNTMNFFGIKDLEIIVTEGHNQFPDRKDAIIEAGVRQASEAGARF
jgi:FMN-dependent NADH-azoreductase